MPSATSESWLLFAALVGEDGCAGGKSRGQRRVLVLVFVHSFPAVLLKNKEVFSAEL